MAASIKIEFDQESYEEAKKKLAELSEMASLVGENFKSAQHRVQWTAFGWLLTAITAGFVSGAVTMYLIIGCH